MINDDQTDVGRVHLGVVHLFDVERPAVCPRETRNHRVRLPPGGGDPGRHDRLRDLVADLHDGAVWKIVGENAGRRAGGR